MQVPKDRPLICVTPRYEPAKELFGERFLPNESLSRGLLDAIVDAGGLPVMMPITDDAALIQRYVDMCDGFVIPGGHSVDPARWGEEPRADASDVSLERDALEFPLVEKVLAADKPLLAICRGMQLLNVALGGTLSQWLYDLPTREGTTHWRHEIILNDPAHPVDVVAGTLLDQVMGARPRLQVNSSHHECVARPGEGVRVDGYATDGIIESIDVPGRRFCLGVQWHPEYTWPTLETDRLLWRSLVEVSAGH